MFMRRIFRHSLASCNAIAINHQMVVACAFNLFPGRPHIHTTYSHLNLEGALDRVTIIGRLEINRIRAATQQ